MEGILSSGNTIAPANGTDTFANYHLHDLYPISLPQVNHGLQTAQHEFGSPADWTHLLNSFTGQGSMNGNAHVLDSAFFRSSSAIPSFLEDETPRVARGNDDRNKLRTVQTNNTMDSTSESDDFQPLYVLIWMSVLMNYFLTFIFSSTCRAFLARTAVGS